MLNVNLLPNFTPDRLKRPSGFIVSECHLKLITTNLEAWFKVGASIYTSFYRRPLDHAFNPRERLNHFSDLDIAGAKI